MEEEREKMRQEIRDKVSKKEYINIHGNIILFMYTWVCVNEPFIFIFIYYILYGLHFSPSHNSLQKNESHSLSFSMMQSVIKEYFYHRYMIHFIIVVVMK